MICITVFSDTIIIFSTLKHILKRVPGHGQVKKMVSVIRDADLGPNTLKSIQIHYSYFDLSMITITLQLQDL